MCYMPQSSYPGVYCALKYTFCFLLEFCACICKLWYPKQNCWLSDHSPVGDVFPLPNIPRMAQEMTHWHPVQRCRMLYLHAPIRFEDVFGHRGTLPYLKITVFWNVNFCSLIEIYQCFRGTHLSSTLKREPANSSDTLANFCQITWRHILEDSTPHTWKIGFCYAVCMYVCM
jgi:hypothetical protein